MTNGGSGVGGLTPSLEGSDEELVPVQERERQFGRYYLRYEVASGGMATVYLARAKGPGGFDRALAVKRIHPHLAKKREFVEMFLDEARLTARVTHPNVCSVFDFGEVDGTYFMAMEYLVGQPLSALLRTLNTRPDLALSPRWRVMAAKIIADACEGLHAAHELTDERGKKLGVIHRDVSPHNVFVTYDGAVKVVDFGVAFAEGRFHQTQTGALKGKLGYMSPEQVRGKEIDRRLDVWALGVCLWELLTVRRLFAKKQEIELIQSVASDPIEAPSHVRAGIPPELDRIVMKALSRDLAQRYPTARAMARDLNAFVSSSGMSAGLADLSELMEELFQRERQDKLDVVASVLQTGSAEVAVAPSASGARAVERAAPALAAERTFVPESADATYAPQASEPTLAQPAPVLAEAPAPTVQHALPPSAETMTRAPLAAAAPPAAQGASFAPPPETPTASPSARVPAWAWVVGGSVAGLAVLVVIVAAASMRGPTPEATPLATPLPVAASGVAPSGVAPSGVAPSVVVASSVVPSTAPPVSDVVVPPSAPEPSVVAAPPAPSVAADPPDAPVAPTTSTPRRAVATGPGTVNIATQGGWADIYVGGESRGRTPRALTLPAGRHDIELRPSGQLPARHVSVVVRAGATSRVVVPLGP